MDFWNKETTGTEIPKCEEARIFEDKEGAGMECEMLKDNCQKKYKIVLSLQI